LDGLAKGKWTCEAKALDGSAVQLDALTVGDVFGLSCRGDAIAWGDSKLQILATGADPTKPDPYTLYIVAVDKLESDGADLQVTTYRPGEIQSATNFTLTDGNHQAVLGGIQIKTVSVVEAGQDGKPPQPFGPVGPVVFWWGIEYWFLLGFAIVLGLSFLVRKVWLVLERRKWKTEVDKVRIARTAFDELHRELRSLLRDRAVALAKDSSSVQIEQEYSSIRTYFFNYITRQFALPAHLIPRRRFLKEVRKDQRWTEISDDLDQLLREMEVHFKKDKAKSNVQALTIQDVDQMIQQIRKFSESVERTLRAGAKQ